jgi:hypothetical protein
MKWLKALWCKAFHTETYEEFLHEHQGGLRIVTRVVHMCGTCGREKRL